MHDPVDPQVRKVLTGTAPRRFDAGFSDRVMGRVGEESNDLLVVSPRQFLRLAAGVVAASLLLAGYRANAAPAAAIPASSCAPTNHGTEPISIPV